ncbi:MAG: hypothetical protein J6P58_04170 [Oscillospiraceae bacterium]|nr:hypothetical protein [Oscillospiraceae bacterium]
MSTSANAAYVRRALWQLGWALFLAFFGAVYEHFSHGVYSYYMLYAFALPLGLGALPWCVLSLRRRRSPCRAAAQLWDSGVLTLAVGSVFRGVLDIYGTTNRLVIVYPAVGAALLLAGAVRAIADRRKEKHR